MSHQFRELNIDVVIDGKTQSISSQRRTEFVELYKLDELIPQRYSEVLVVDLLVDLELNGNDPAHIVDEIKHLELLGSVGFTKKASQFKHIPLHPLWHQHYFSVRHLIPNIQNELRRNYDTIWKESTGNAAPVNDPKIIANLINDLIQGSVERRSDEQRITGEWLVFSENSLGNIYLCTAKHGQGDQNIYDKIKYSCQHEFPMLEPFASDRQRSNL